MIRFLSTSFDRPLAPTPSPWYRKTSVCWFLVLLVLHCGGPTVARAEEKNAAMANRLHNAVGYLASDDLEGRGVGTKGLDAAAEYLADQFARIGLNTDAVDGGAFQIFTLPASPEMGPPAHNRVTFEGPEGTKPRVLKLDQDFSTLAIGGSGQVTGPVVFVGYGITAKRLGYDDYAGVDVKGKVVLMLRKEPRQADPKSPFNGTQASLHATFRHKIANATAHGVAAVILINDAYDLRRRSQQAIDRLRKTVDQLADAVTKFAKLDVSKTEEIKKDRSTLLALADRARKLGAAMQGDADELIGFLSAGTNNGSGKMPVFFCRRRAIDAVIEQALGRDLATLEREIDQGPTPHSQQLDGWAVACQAEISRRSVEVKNVVGTLEGRGNLADQTIVVGAHYDHLGMGGRGSRSPTLHEVHNGADDNASGTAAVLEVARQLVARGHAPRRRVVFIAFTGEERGLLGSRHYVNHPLFPLDQTVAMINLDMIGRLKDNQLIIGGSGTGDQFDKLIDVLNKTYAFQLTKQPGGRGPSDHMSFFGKRIPVLHFFTGLHGDYHRPSDDVERINVDGMVRISQFVADLVVRLDEEPKPPAFQAAKNAGGKNRRTARAYLGTMPDFSRSVDGFALADVAPDSPAAKAGLRAGDVIVQFGDQPIKGMQDLVAKLSKSKPGDKVGLVVQRDGNETKVTVTLGRPK